MRSPPLAPQGFDYETYIVLDDLGKLGRAYREVEEEQANKATVIRDISDGQYSNPVRVVAFNTAKGWSRDVTEDIACEMMDLAHRGAEPLSKPAQTFVEWATGEDVPVSLRAGGQRCLKVALLRRWIMTSCGGIGKPRPVSAPAQESV